MFSLEPWRSREMRSRRRSSDPDRIPNRDCGTPSPLAQFSSWSPGNTRGRELSSSDNWKQDFFWSQVILLPYDSWGGGGTNQSSLFALGQAFSFHSWITVNSVTRWGARGAAAVGALPKPQGGLAARMSLTPDPHWGYAAEPLTD